MRGAFRHSLRGFTLIELVVVMTLLAAILAIAAPRLGRFMAGRDLVEESRRLMAMARYARSEAIAQSERTELWFNPETREYGVRTSAEHLRDLDKPVAFELAAKLALVIEGGLRNDNGEVVILFWPDGSIDEHSPRSLTIVEEDIPRKEMVLTENRLNYELRDVATQ